MSDKSTNFVMFLKGFYCRHLHFSGAVMKLKRIFMSDYYCKILQPNVYTFVGLLGTGVKEVLKNHEERNLKKVRI